MISTRRSVFALGAAGLSGLALSPFASAAGSSGKETATPVKPPLLGDAKAPKRLVVWGSYTCPYTAALIALLSKIVTDLNGVANVEWHHFPTHPPDPALHVGALGFRDQHFWNYTFAIMRTVLAANGDYRGLTPEKLAEFAKNEGGSAATLEAAYADKAKWAAVKEDLIAGRLLGITRTPGLFYNGYFMTPNGIPTDFKAFDKSLRAMLQGNG